MFRSRRQASLASYNVAITGDRDGFTWKLGDVAEAVANLPGIDDDNLELSAYSLSDAIEAVQSLLLVFGQNAVPEISGGDGELGVKTEKKWAPLDTLNSLIKFYGKANEPAKYLPARDTFDQIYLTDRSVKCMFFYTNIIYFLDEAKANATTFKDIWVEVVDRYNIKNKALKLRLQTQAERANGVPYMLFDVVQAFESLGEEYNLFFEMLSDFTDAIPKKRLGHELINVQDYAKRLFHALRIILFFEICDVLSEITQKDNGDTFLWQNLANIAISPESEYYYNVDNKPVNMISEKVSGLSSALFGSDNHVYSGYIGCDTHTDTDSKYLKSYSQDTLNTKSESASPKSRKVGKYGASGEAENSSYTSESESEMVLFGSDTGNGEREFKSEETLEYNSDAGGGEAESESEEKLNLSETTALESSSCLLKAWCSAKYLTKVATGPGNLKDRLIWVPRNEVEDHKTNSTKSERIAKMFKHKIELCQKTSGYFEHTVFEIAEYCLMYMVMQFDETSKIKVPSKPKHNDEIMLQTVLKRLFAPRHLNQGDPLFEYMKMKSTQLQELVEDEIIGLPKPVYISEKGKPRAPFGKVFQICRKIWGKNNHPDSWDLSKLYQLKVVTPEGEQAFDLAANAIKLEKARIQFVFDKLLENPEAPIHHFSVYRQNIEPLFKDFKDIKLQGVNTITSGEAERFITQEQVRTETAISPQDGELPITEDILTGAVGSIYGGVILPEGPEKYGDSMYVLGPMVWKRICKVLQKKNFNKQQVVSSSAQMAVHQKYVELERINFLQSGLLENPLPLNAADLTDIALSAKCDAKSVAQYLAIVRHAYDCLDSALHPLLHQKYEEVVKTWERFKFGEEIGIGVSQKLDRIFEYAINLLVPKFITFGSQLETKLRNTFENSNSVIEVFTRNEIMQMFEKIYVFCGGGHYGLSFYSPGDSITFFGTPRGQGAMGFVNKTWGIWGTEDDTLHRQLVLCDDSASLILKLASLDYKLPRSLWEGVLSLLDAAKLLDRTKEGIAGVPMTPGLNVATEEIDDILEVVSNISFFFTANRVDTFKKALENYECAHRINEGTFKNLQQKASAIAIDFLQNWIRAQTQNPNPEHQGKKKTLLSNGYLTNEPDYPQLKKLLLALLGGNWANFCAEIYARGMQNLEMYSSQDFFIDWEKIYKTGGRHITSFVKESDVSKVHLDYDNAIREIDSDESSDSENSEGESETSDSDSDFQGEAEKGNSKSQSEVESGDINGDTEISSSTFEIAASRLRYAITCAALNTVVQPKKGDTVGELLTEWQKKFKSEKNLEPISDKDLLSAFYPFLDAYDYAEDMFLRQFSIDDGLNGIINRFANLDLTYFQPLLSMPYKNKVRQLKFLPLKILYPSEDVIGTYILKLVGRCEPNCQHRLFYRYITKSTISENNVELSEFGVYWSAENMDVFSSLNLFFAAHKLLGYVSLSESAANKFLEHVFFNDDETFGVDEYGGAYDYDSESDIDQSGYVSEGGVDKSKAQSKKSIMPKRRLDDTNDPEVPKKQPRLNSIFRSIIQSDTGFNDKKYFSQKVYIPSQSLQNIQPPHSGEIPARRLVFPAIANLKKGDQLQRRATAETSVLYVSKKRITVTELMFHYIDQLKLASQVAYQDLKVKREKGPSDWFISFGGEQVYGQFKLMWPAVRELCFADISKSFESEQLEKGQTGLEICDKKYESYCKDLENLRDRKRTLQEQADKEKEEQKKAKKSGSIKTDEDVHIFGESQRSKIAKKYEATFKDLLKEKKDLDLSVKIFKETIQRITSNRKKTWEACEQLFDKNDNLRFSWCNRHNLNAPPDFWLNLVTASTGLK